MGSVELSIALRGNYISLFSHFTNIKMSAIYQYITRIEEQKRLISTSCSYVNKAIINTLESVVLVR